MEIILLIIGLCVGFFTAWFVQRYRFASQKTVPLRETEDLLVEYKKNE